jgi:hypothetical protein
MLLTCSGPLSNRMHIGGAGVGDADLHSVFSFSLSVALAGTITELQLSKNHNRDYIVRLG